MSDLEHAWDALPNGARAALEEQWKGLAAGALPCGAAIVDAQGQVVAASRNHAYDLAGDLASRAEFALQHTRIAHAEMNALAHIATEVDHASLTLWSTQHPCLMCAAAIKFIGVGRVHFVADDPSDGSSAAEIEATRRGVSYEPLGDPLWWTISNLLFLYNSTVRDGEKSRNLVLNRDRYPGLVKLVRGLAGTDALGAAAQAGMALPAALASYSAALKEVPRFAPQSPAPSG